MKCNKTDYKCHLSVKTEVTGNISSESYVKTGEPCDISRKITI